MATYDELAELLKPGGDQGLRGKVSVATMVACELIRQEVPADPQNPTETEQGRKRYAQRTLRSTARHDISYHSEFEQIYRAVVMQNRAATLANILGATDAQIQNNVDTAIDFVVATFPDPLPAP